MYYFSGMKNIQGKEESLKLFNDKGGLIYEFYKGFFGQHAEYTYDDNGNCLTFKESSGYWAERTYNDQGNKLTYKNSKDEWSERTYDDQGNELTYKNSNGVSRTYETPEYTMEELTEMIGNFKIKKQ